MNGAAKPRGLKAVRTQEAIEIDGVPGEWIGDWRALAFTVAGTQASEADLSARAIVLYDADNLYLAADVRDDQLVAGGDALELVLGIPGGIVHRIRVIPGGKGKRAAAKSDAGPIAGARVVEAPSPNGWSIEAAIPWKTIPRSDVVRVGYRGALVVHDVDGAREETVLASADSLAYASLPPLSTEPELSLGAGLLREKGLTAAPLYNLLADVVGDKRLERVLVYDRYLAILGPGYRDGQQYFYRDLGTTELVRFEVDDVTGDGRGDFIVRKRAGAAELVEVLSYHGDSETPEEVFSQSLAPRDTIRVGHGKGAKIAVTIDGTTKTFAFRDGKFALDAGSDESASTPPPSLPVPAPAPAPISPPPPPPPSSPPPPAKPKKDPNGPDTNAVYNLYKQKRGVTGKARFDFQADVAEDGAKERVVVHGSDVVVFGPGFRGGRSFAAVTLGVDAADIEDVSAKAVSGTGKSDIVVRAKMRAPLPDDLGPGEMVRAVVMVFAVRDSSIDRVFAAEVGRRVGDKHVEDKLTLGSGTIEITPGRATGYDEQSYPWKQKDAPDGGFEPLLLPWGGIARVKLKFDGKEFVRA